MSAVLDAPVTEPRSLARPLIPQIAQTQRIERHDCPWCNDRTPHRFVKGPDWWTRLCLRCSYERRMV